MVTNKQLEGLRREIDKEKEKIKRQKLVAETVSEKKRLQKELILLRNPRKFAFGRKIVRVGRKVGGAIITQARLIKEQQEREAKKINPVPRGINPKKLRKQLRPKKIKKSSKTKSNRGFLGGFNPMADLDF